MLAGCSQAAFECGSKITDVRQTSPATNCGSVCPRLLVFVGLTKRKRCHCNGIHTHDFKVRLDECVRIFAG